MYEIEIDMNNKNFSIVFEIWRKYVKSMRGLKTLGFIYWAEQIGIDISQVFHPRMQGTLRFNSEQEYLAFILKHS